MTTKYFPRKEIYIYSSKKPLPSKNVIALQDREINLTTDFKRYAEERWSTENKGWTSSILPSSVEVDCNDKSMKIHCGMSEYKYLLGMVKLANETKKCLFLKIISED